MDLRWLSRVREADPSALAELSNAVSVKDAKYTVRDNPSFKAARWMCIKKNVCMNYITTMLNVESI